MSIKYNDEGLIVNYIQMFLKKYYSEFINIEHSYSRNIQENIINFLNLPDPKSMTEVSNSLTNYPQYTDMLNGFKKIDLEEDIKFESRLSHEEKGRYSAYIDMPDVRWMYNNLKDFNNYLLDNFGWKVKNFNYNNSDNKCEILITRVSNKILPKSCMVDLINTFDSVYNETIFGFDNSNRSDTYFSSLYNFEIKNYEQSLVSGGKEYEVYLPQDDDENPMYRIIKTNLGTYQLLNRDDEVIVNNFRGLKTFACNIYDFKTNSSEDDYYCIYFKRPIAYDDNGNEIENLKVYVNFSERIGEELTISYDLSSTIEINDNDNFAILDLMSSSEPDKKFFKDQDGNYYCSVIMKIPKEIDGKDIDNYKLCVSFYDPNNEINTILAFRMDNKYLNNVNKNNDFYNYETEICPIKEKSDKTISSVSFISPDSYYKNPFILHDKFITYILNRIITEYSNDNDIISAQKELLLLKYPLYNEDYGVYTDKMKSYIKEIQDNHRTEVFYGKGYIDPDTEFIMGYEGGDY